LSREAFSSSSTGTRASCSSTRNTVIGEGAADCRNCLREIHALGYNALVTIDFEHDTPRLQEDMVKNIAFVEEQARSLP
jgi:sugar phosphate isomerase/epimerase